MNTERETCIYNEFSAAWNTHTSWYTSLSVMHARPRYKQTHSLTQLLLLFFVTSTVTVVQF